MNKDSYLLQTLFIWTIFLFIFFVEKALLLLSNYIAIAS